MYDDELRTFKRDVHLLDYAVERHGYERDRRESSQASHVLRQPSTGDKIVVSRDSDGHWVYFSVRDERDRGTIIDFIQRREPRSLGEVRQMLRQWLGTPRPELPAPSAHAAAPVERSPAAVLRAFAAAELLDHSPYLHARGLRPETLRDPRFAPTWRQDRRGNVLFLHQDERGPTGFEIKNRGFTGFSPGGTRTVWTSLEQGPERRLVVCESAIDALSYFQLHAAERGATRYLSTGGTPSRAQLELLGRAFARLPCGGLVVAAVDRDAPGAQIAERLRALAGGRAGIAFERHSPAAHKDWNDVLREVERDLLLALPPHLRSLDRDRERSR